MKLTKSSLLKTIEPYIRTRYGEIVVERYNIEKLRSILFASYDNISCEVEEGIRSEKFVLYSVTKGGIRRYIDIPIVDVENSDSEVWNLDEVISQLVKLTQDYGFAVFKDNKRSAALIGDVLIKYSNENKVLKVLFREGLSEVLGNIPYKNDRDLRNALHRTEVFMLNMGMSLKIVANVKHIIKRVFVDYSSFRADKVAHGRVHDSDFENIGNIPAVQKKDLIERLPQGRLKPGNVYALTTSSDMTRFSLIETVAVSGNGEIECVSKDYQSTPKLALNLLMQNQNYAIPGVSTENINFVFDYQDLNYSGEQSNLVLPTVISVCSAVLKRSVLDNLIVIGSTSVTGNIVKSANLGAEFVKSAEIGAKKILLPITSVADIANVPAELIAKFSLLFYSSVQDAVYKALGLK